MSAFLGLTVCLGWKKTESSGNGLAVGALLVTSYNNESLWPKYIPWDCMMRR